MTTDRFAVDHFLASLESIDFRQPEPDHVLDRRARLSAMVLTEIGDDDLEQWALRGLASATLQLCVLAGDVGAAEDWVAAYRAYAEVCTGKAM